MRTLIKQSIEPLQGIITDIQESSIVERESTPYDDIVIAIGLGGSEQAPTVRFPAYIIPALETGRQLKTQGFENFKIRVFKANHISTLTNGFDPHKVEEVSKATFHYLSAFANRFYPDMKDHILFESDNKWGDNFGHSSLRDTVDRFAEILGKAECLKEEVASVRRMGAKHGGEQGELTALFYAAAHPLYSQMIGLKEDHKRLPFTPFLADHNQPSLVVEFGGRPQETFNRVCLHVSEALPTTCFKATDWIGIIHQQGTIPPYYHAPYGEWVLGDEKPSSKKMDRFAKRDITFIEVTVGQQAFGEFLKDYVKHQAPALQALASSLQKVPPSLEDSFSPPPRRQDRSSERALIARPSPA